MNKEDFLRELQESLVGEVSDQEIRESISYYRNYIADEMQQGKSEQEVLQSLGSARLIGRSIIDAALDGKEEAGHYYGTTEEVSFDENNHQEYPEVQERKNQMMRTIRTVIVGVLIVAAVAVALKVFVALLPLICVLVIVGMIWRRIQ